VADTVRRIAIVAMRVSNDSVCRVVGVSVRVTLRHVGDIGDTASSSFCDAVMGFLLHRVERVLGSDGLPITVCTSERPVLDKRSNLASQASVRDWD
jgi:hypothetical protein